MNTNTRASNYQTPANPAKAPLVPVNNQELLKKYEILKKQGETLKQKKTELLTKMNIAKDNAQKIANEIKQEFNIEAPEEFAQWLEEQKQTQAKNLAQYEEQLNSAQAKLNEVEEKLK